MSVFLPLLLLGPVMLLLTAVLALASYGPFGWLAATALLAAVAYGTWWGARTGWAWWGRTKAPVRDDGRSPWARQRHG